MDHRICKAGSNNTFMLDNHTYFYQPCVGNSSTAVGYMVDCINRIESTNETQCAQFCETFPRVLPATYVGISCLSALCCLGVFATYFSFPRLRQSGYSSKVFLYRYRDNRDLSLGP